MEPFSWRQHREDLGATMLHELVLFLMYTQSYSCILSLTYSILPSIHNQSSPLIYVKNFMLNILEMSMMAHDAKPVSQKSSKNKKLEWKKSIKHLSPLMALRF